MAVPQGRQCQEGDVRAAARGAGQQREGGGAGCWLDGERAAAGWWHGG